MDQREVPIIDRTSCTGCGACIAICPDRILSAAFLPSEARSFKFRSIT